MKSKRIFSTKSLFYAVVVSALLTLGLMLFPEIGSVLGPLILILWGLLALAGIGLVIATLRENRQGRVRFFLLSCGFSAIGFLLGVVLHNMFYALGMLAEELPILPGLISILGGGFFLIAVILCPIGLLVGVVGTLVLWKEI